MGHSATEESLTTGNAMNTHEKPAQDTDGRQMEQFVRARMFGADEVAQPPVNAGEPTAKAEEPTAKAEEPTAKAGEPTVGGSTAPSAGRRDARAPGSLVGRYVLLDRIGVGGMGEVYAGYDPELDRKVAIKLVLPERSGEASRTRLLREAQALAKLAHPNVVTIHDVGEHEGHVWLAMEYVAGQTLGAWAKSGRSRWLELLRVLTDTARGVASAHAAGLIHRDLKPDNVMIGRDGRVRVMDFGLAHGRPSASTENGPPGVDAAPVNDPGHGVTVNADPRIRPEVAALGLRLTGYGQPLGTPAYMAPEQWKGEEARPATDQFQWSVMAWEILFGERPFADTHFYELVESVMSDRRRPPPRGHKVPGWLRRLVERGLATNPAMRWRSMAELVSRLERGQARARYRTIAAASGGLVLIAAGIAGARHLNLVQRSAECEAEGASIAAIWNDEAKEAVRASFLATGVPYAESAVDKVLPWINAYSQAWSDAREGTCKSAEVHGTWSADMGERAQWCLEDRRMEFAALLADFAQADTTTVQNGVVAAASLGSVEPCQSVEQLSRIPMPPQEIREGIAPIRSSLARANSLGLAGKYKAGLDVARIARESAEREIGWLPLVISARYVEGDLLNATGAYSEAEPVLKNVYFDAANLGLWDLADDSASGLLFLVGCRLAQTAQGFEWARHAELAAAQLGDRDERRKSRRLNNLANLNLFAGKFVEATKLYQQSLAIRENLLGADHPFVADVLAGISGVYDASGDYDRALEADKRVLAIREQVLGRDHPEYAYGLTNLGNIYYSMGDYREARTLHERALLLATRALGPEHPELAQIINNLAIACDVTGDLAEAHRLHEEAIRIKRKTLGERHPGVASSLENLAAVEDASGEVERANALYREALGIREEALGPTHPLVATALLNLAGVESRMGNIAEAKAMHERALEIRRNVQPPNSVAVAESLMGLANIYYRMNDLKEAERLHREALAMRVEALGNEHPYVAMSLFNLAEVRGEMGAYDDARALHRRALGIYEVKQGATHPAVAHSLDRLAAMFLAEERPRDALPLLERSVAIYEQYPGQQPGEAVARLDLARALIETGGDAARAVAEAETALAQHREAGQGDAEAVAAVEAWLARHRPRRP